MLADGNAGASRDRVELLAADQINGDQPAGRPAAAAWYAPSPCPLKYLLNKKGWRRRSDTTLCLLMSLGLAEEHLVGVRQVELSAAEAGVAVPVLVVERGTSGDLAGR